MSQVKVLAINLPQFHPFPENDNWWGKGFTEWTNVVGAKPLFKGHNQPQLPADNGFYDLRLPESREIQAKMAADYNIDGFCYYHYWFGGTRLMKEPIDQILESQNPDFPFCYFWANESWSRRWMGEEKDVLIAQSYSESDDYEHANWLVKSFKDKRYITVGGRPLFLIYKPFDLPHPQKTFSIFEEVCAENNIPKPFFVASNSHNIEINPMEIGFDAAIHFQTRHTVLSEFWIDGFTIKRFARNILKGVLNPTLKLYSYKKYKQAIKKFKITYDGFPCVLVGFDNTARRGKKAIILDGQNVADFKESLMEAKQIAEKMPQNQQIVFINAWNEWAEGNHLEPCSTFGHSFLQAVKDVFSK